ncbi:myosin-11 [Lucilia cuprina]|uniref:myosin-11 n=1 Tax=Lucilia cuprina TaxID=7375 RepID=UPI001F06FDA8|nr:myosin-11 [Lucilia cuprina]
MAFSTQKDFFHVPFMNESPDLGCKKACVKLKSYESTIDDRSWANDEAKQSKFLSDLVTCQYPAAAGFGEGDFSSSDINVGRDEAHDYVSASRGATSSARPRNQGDVSAAGMIDDVVNELQSVKLQCLHDNQTQTGKNQTDELAFYTCATLDEILKELKKKGCLNDETMIAYGLEPAPNDSTFEYDKQCCREMRRLQQQVDELKEEMKEGAQCDAMCADALKRLKELETENNKLLREKQDLNEKLKDGEDKMVNMLKKIEHLDKEINKNGQEASRIGRDLQGTMGLVQDISDVQLRNQQLTNAVSAINSRDDQKIIDDLRRQLEEELSKLKKCQIDNARLQEEVKVRDMDLKELKDLNNKLEADKKKLEKEYNQLKNDRISLKNNLINKSEDKVKRGNNEELENDKHKAEKVDNKSKTPSDKEQVKSSEYKYNEGYSDKSQAALNNNPDKLIKSAKSEELPNKSKTSLSKNQDKFGKSPHSEELTDKYKTALSKTQDQLGKSPHSEEKPDKSKTLNKKPENSLEYRDKDETKELITKTAIKKVPDSPKQTLKDAKQTDNREKNLRNSDNIKKASNEIKQEQPTDDTTTPISNKTKAAALEEYEKKVDVFKQPSSDQHKAAALDDFVYKKSDTLKFNLQQGRNFEKELRKILEEFIHECGYCFCRLFNTKSKLYTICHKLYHSGIGTLSFRELAYLHKKIYAQAEQLLPGCLLDMILSDHREKVESMLNISLAEPRLVGGHESDLKMSNVMLKEQKCCCCKNELCCSNSEEMLKDKVNKLEKDIEIAREYLETLKNIPLETSLPTDDGDSTDTNNSTYRASSTVMIQQKSRHSKHIKKLKSRLMKHSDI